MKKKEPPHKSRIYDGTKSYGTYRVACGECFRAFQVQLVRAEDAEVCPKCGSKLITVS